MHGTVHGEFRMGFAKPAAHFIGLPEGKRAATGTDTHYRNCHLYDRTSIQAESPQNLRRSLPGSLPGPLPEVSPAGIAAVVELSAALE